MEWYIVTKTIKGHQYLYRQKTYRVGSRVRTINQYIGPATGAIPVGRPGPSVTTTAAPVAATKKRSALPRFDEQKGVEAFESIMGDAGMPREERCMRDRQGPVVVTPNRRVDGLCERLGVQFSRKSAGSYYRLDTDTINIPPLRCFGDFENQSAKAAYQSVLFHELVHWTSKRLGRVWPNSLESYAREELVAELGSVMLMKHFAFETGDPRYAATYFQDWLTMAGSRSEVLAYAQREAARAVQWILDHGR